MSAQPLVVIIVLNYNGLRDTLECLQSLRGLEYGNFRTIVVDNASRENPLPVLREKFPEVQCIRSETNLGFTGGNNLGLAHAYDLEPGYVFFLNNDTVATPGLLDRMVGFMEENPEVGIVGPLTYYFDEPETVCFAGGELNRNTGRISFYRRGDRWPDPPDEVIDCTFVEGAAILIRTELVRRIGGFNDAYFLTSEESEMCTKVRDLGFRLKVLTSCSIRHKVSRSMVAGSELISYFVYRNRLHFVRNNGRNIGAGDLLSIASGYGRSLLSLVVKKRNLPAAVGLVKGVFDFARGVDGPGRYRVRLQTASGLETGGK